jgi:CubicO group peptidase (beta-lactamase class C family)
MRSPSQSILLIALTAAISDPVFSQDRQIAAIEAKVSLAVAVRGESEKTASLEERMRELNVPAASIAVVNNGQLEWAKAYGYADKENGTLATPETLFQATAISSAVSAMGAMKLVEDGRLELDRNVNEVLDSWRVPENEFTREGDVTLRRLLNHTAGTNGGGFGGYETEGALPSIVEVLDGAGNSAPVRIVAKPGTVYSPSGGGYAVAQLLMMDVTGEPFTELMAALVLDPLQMTNSTYQQPLPAEWAARAASGYDTQGNRISGRWRVYPEMAWVGLWTTPSDLARYIIEVQRAYAGQGKVLSRDAARSMLEKGLGGHALGPMIEVKGRQFGLGGSTFGFNTLMTGSIEDGFGAVILTNSNNGPKLAHELMRTIGYEYDWPGVWQKKAVVTLSEAQYKSVAGRYQTRNGIFEISYENGGLYVLIEGDDPLQLMPQSEFVFFDRECCTWEFSHEAGAVTAFEVLEGGFRGTRIN